VLTHTGIVLGKWHGRTLRFAGETHTLIVAPSGSGKTASLGVPTALTWQPSLFLNDPKGELYPLTAGWRRTFSRVQHLNPTAPDSDCYDPLQGIRLDTDYEVRDASLITDILVNPDGERPQTDAGRHFMALTSMFVRGITLHGLLTGQARTLPELAQFFFAEASLETILHEMETSLHSASGPHPAVRWAVRLLKRLADRELSGVCSTVARALDMTLDPLVARVLSRSDFTMADLRERRRPMSLYLTVPYSDQERLRTLSRLVVRQVLDWSTQRLGGWRHRLCMLLDEVQALKYLPAIPGALDFVRGYGLMLVLITPSLNELDREYGPSNNFVEGCHLRLTFAPNDPTIADKFSRMTGTSEQTDGQRTWEERLLSTTGLTYLPKDQGLLLIGNGGYPALITKAPYYRNWRLTRRSRIRTKA
jgi:type IV secretion system protein VirD4